MRTLPIFVTITVALCLSPAAWGQRALSGAESQQILQQVTSRPRQTWLPAGTIQAIHKEHGAPKTTDETFIRNEIDKEVTEYQNSASLMAGTTTVQKMKLDAIPFNVRYKLSNESAMSSRVTVKYDNGRFYWEINVDWRQDSVLPDATLAGNYMTKHVDLRWNKRRIFAWDGQEYTTYSASGNHAVVDAAGKLKRAVTGPLTAGLIPWGYGRFSSARLAAAQVSARQNAGGTIDMTLKQADGFSASLTLDPTKAYAVTKATVTSAGGAVVTYTCSGYRLAGSNWVPWNIVIERQNESLGSRLPTSEQWTFTSVSAAVPPSSSFHVPVAADTIVEYSSPVAASPAIYVQSDLVDTRGLLAQRLAYAAGENSRRQNCATAALQQVAADLGKSVSESTLARLVGPDGRTSMYGMMRCAQSLGLYVQAVKTDLTTLASLAGVRVILHLPGRNHFVVLDGIDNRYVWLTDLSSRKFHYRQKVEFFPMEWSEGVALVVSDRPISGSFTTLADGALGNLFGGAGWACNDLLQESFVIYCSEVLFECDGAVVVVFERWGCGRASSGSCSEEMMVGSVETGCIFDNYYDCTVTGEWYYYEMSACG